MSKQIADKHVVSMHYVLRDDTGEILDQSAEGSPLTYLHGAGNIIPGLENALTGKAPGDNVQVQVPPAQAYGESNPAMVQVVPRAAFQGIETIEPGMNFQATNAEGATQQITVTAVDGDAITIDANHPLAGVELNFDVKIEDVREATEEELAHGHVHD